jgi:tetratricopeptide (TPR) repeat protein
MKSNPADALWRRTQAKTCPTIFILLIGASAIHAQPTFVHEVAPIIYKSCATCHRPGAAGPFPLLTYDDVKKHGRQIAQLVSRRLMPPWPPAHGRGDFAGELRLTADEIQTIVNWVNNGEAQGPVQETPPLPQFVEGWQLGPPDLILEASKSFDLAAGGGDVYWNFLFTANIPAPRWVRAIEIHPGNARLVHHANLYVDRARSARRQGDGFPGMEPVIERTVFEPDDGHFLYWKPGGIPYAEPEGLAWRLDPGNDLVLNTHLLPSGKREQVRPSIGIYFTDQPQKQFPMLVQLDGDGALDIPAGAADFVVSDDFKLPFDCAILAIYPHAHDLGRLLEAYATLPDHSRQWLIQIPQWNRTWEAVYRYREAVVLPKDTVISMRFHYDNSAANPRNPNHPPKRVVAGDKVTDEMSHLWLQVLPLGGRDRRLELQEAVMRHRLEKYPDDFPAHLYLGEVKLARLDRSGAAAEFQTAVRLRPRSAEAHNMLGSSLLAQGRMTEAIEQFRLAVQSQPDYQNARYNLARALARAGRLDEALALFRDVVAAYPNDAQAHNALGELLYRQGKSSEAIAEFDRAIALDPSFEAAKKNRDIAAQRVP